jgi:hypothetical protein
MSGVIAYDRRRHAQAPGRRSSVEGDRGPQRTVEGVWARHRRLPPLVTLRECANYFEAAGYEPTPKRKALERQAGSLSSAEWPVAGRFVGERPIFG